VEIVRSKYACQNCAIFRLPITAFFAFDIVMSPTPPPSKKSTTRELTTQLPLVRVKRIIKVDKDIQKCGNEAATLITRATVFSLIDRLTKESFVQFFAEQVFHYHSVALMQGYHFARVEGRKTVQYKDLGMSLKKSNEANAVARIDQLEFLSDIIPRTIRYKQALQRKEQALNEPDSPEENGHSSSRKKGRSRDTSGGRGGIERYLTGSTKNNGIHDFESDEEAMEVD
jgi:histone H3/H4